MRILEKLKHELEILNKALRLIETEAPEIRIYDLLKMMFIIVYRSMARQEWLESPFVKIFLDEKNVCTDEDAACLEKTLS